VSIFLGEELPKSSRRLKPARLYKDIAEK
jgi:hypothetical protein